MFIINQYVDEDGFCSCEINALNLEAGQLKQVKITGRALVLARIGDEIFAFDDTCPHGAASLAKGSISRHKISCPDHGYCFDIRSGGLLWPENEHYRLRKHTVKVDDGQIKIRLNEV
jgi:3-phenylpropionate/trans-cinnamate dioxygenase ferredoxin subunit